MNVQKAFNYSLVACLLSASFASGAGHSGVEADLRSGSFRRLAQLLPADSQFFLFCDLSKISSRPGGGALVRGLKHSLREYVESQETGGAFDKALEELQLATGLDPLGAQGRFIVARRDVGGSYNLFWDPRIFNVIAQGAFDITGAAIEEHFGRQERSYWPGGEIHFHRVDERREWSLETWAVAVREKGLLYLGDKQWIDVALRGGQARSLDARLLSLSDKIRYQDQLWIVIDSPVFSRRLFGEGFLEKPLELEEEQIPRLILSLRVGKGLELELRMITESAAGAESLLAALRGISLLETLEDECLFSSKAIEKELLSALRRAGKIELDSNQIIWTIDLPAPTLQAGSELVGLAVLLTLNSF